MATIASTQSAKKLFEDNKIRLSERVQANVLLLGSLTRQVQRGSKSSEVRKKKNSFYFDELASSEIE